MRRMWFNGQVIRYVDHYPIWAGAIYSKDRHDYTYQILGYAYCQRCLNYHE